MTVPLRPALQVYAALLAATALVASLVLILPGAAEQTREALALTVANRAHGPTVPGLLAHNLRPVAGLVLAGLAAWRLGRGRVLLDVALIALAAANAAAIGAALGAYGSLAAGRLWHLPFEYAALAVAGGFYTAHRIQAPRGRDVLAPAAMAAALMAAAAVLEVAL